MLTIFCELIRNMGTMELMGNVFVVALVIQKIKKVGAKGSDGK